MWQAVVYLCGVLHGDLDCVKIQESRLPVILSRCESDLHLSWMTVASFKRSHPEFVKYRAVYRECEYVPVEDT